MPKKECPTGSGDEISNAPSRLLLVAKGQYVTHPHYMNALPFIQRERMTWEQFRAHAEAEGLPEPTPHDWVRTFELTEAELEEACARIQRFCAGLR